MVGSTLRPLAVAAAFALVAGVAVAQTRFDDAQIDAFGDAVARASAVAESWRPRVEAARDAAEQQRLVEAVSAEISRTIEATRGITLREYEAIVVAMRSDPELTRRVEDELRERQLGR